jgi:hypothetical protein
MLKSDPPEGVDDAPPTQGRKGRRRVVVPPPDGVDPTPEGEPDRFGDNDNDERLKADVPPHWG